MTEPHLICTVAIELSRARWIIGTLPPRGTKVTVGAVTGDDTERLMEHLNKIEARLAREFWQPSNSRSALRWKIQTWLRLGQ